MLNAFTSSGFNGEGMVQRKTSINEEPYFHYMVEQLTRGKRMVIHGRSETKMHSSQCTSKQYWKYSARTKQVDPAFSCSCLRGSLLRSKFTKRDGAPFQAQKLTFIALHSETSYDTATPWYKTVTCIGAAEVGGRREMSV